MVTVAGHAYTWDVLGDPGFAARTADLGIRRVTLAAAYHSTRAATPLHPARQLVDAPYAALYRPVRDTAWGTARLRPLSPAWTDEPDPYGRAARALADAGMDVAAWIVLTHNTRLGTEHPDVAVVNCFGEPYPYALCPAHEEVREYAATLAAEAVRDTATTSVSLEACGQLGLTHLSHHEKTEGAWTPTAVRLLSVCCCAACRAGWRGRGLDPDAVVAALRAGVRTENTGGEAVMDPKAEAVVLEARHAAADLLRRRVLDGLPSRTPVTLHANPDPWATGPSPGLTPAAARDVDALLVPAWPATAASANVVEAAVDVVGSGAAGPAAGGERAPAGVAGRGVDVDAYVTVLAPTDADAVLPHVRRLVAAGARRLSLYHLGLSPSWRRGLLGEVVAEVGA